MPFGATENNLPSDCPSNIRRQLSHHLSVFFRLNITSSLSAIHHKTWFPDLLPSWLSSSGHVVAFQCRVLNLWCPELDTFSRRGRTKAEQSGTIHHLALLIQLKIAVDVAHCIILLTHVYWDLSVHMHGWQANCHLSYIYGSVFLYVNEELYPFLCWNSSFF